jgi:hypothetical protein
MEYDPNVFELVLNLCLGLGLSAACGFRIFVPLLALSLASHSGYLTLASGFEWIGSTPALVTLGVATVLEIAAYYIPWVDNVLDLVGAPAAVVAGVVTTASAVAGMDPLLQWSAAVIAGGGVAGVVHGAMALVRKASSLTTLGVGNPVISTAEAGGSLVLATTAIFLPMLAVAIVISAVMALFRLAHYWRNRGRREGPEPVMGS